MSLNQQRLAYVGRRAYELARSGNYEDFASIQSALMAEGYADSVPWLELPGVMAALKEICQISREDPTDGSAIRINGKLWGARRAFSVEPLAIVDEP
jgi:hypothetical protein